MPPKILVTTTTFPAFVPGHVTPPFVYDLSRFVAQTEAAPMIVLAPFIDGAAAEEERDGLLVHRFKYGFTSLCDGAILPNLRKNKLLYFQIPFFLVAAAVAALRDIRRHDISVIHAHWILPQGLLAVLCRALLRRDLRIVCTSHGGDLFGLRRLGWLKRWVLRRADAVTMVSTALTRELDRLAAHSVRAVHVIPMGVDTTLFAPERADPAIRDRYGIRGPFILFVGRLAEKKGVGYLLAALPEVLAAHPDAKALIVGDGPMEAELRAMATELGIAASVVFTGALPNDVLPTYYASADIFVGPSIVASDGDREGLPVAFMEAMSSGCVVVATDLDGMDDLIDSGRSGFIVPQKDSAAITRRILDVLDNATTLADLKRTAVETTRARFDWRVIARRYGDVLLDRA